MKNDKIHILIEMDGDYIGWYESRVVAASYDLSKIEAKRDEMIEEASEKHKERCKNDKSPPLPYEEFDEERFREINRRNNQWMRLESVDLI